MKPRTYPGLLLVSILFAYMLSVVALPHFLGVCRPQFLVLVMVFWALKSENRSLLWISWFSGLGLDLLTSSVLGVHALALMLLVYPLMKIKPYLQHYHRWQHGLLMAVLCLFYVAILAWSMGFYHHSYVLGQYVWSALTSAVTWFLVYPYLPNLQNQRSSSSVYMAGR